jgi:hypothetical protein
MPQRARHLGAACEEPATPFEAPIFVLGLPRSGTSLVAGLLAQCGVWTGTTVPAGPENPRGFYEHVLLRDRVVKGILARAGFDPLGARRLPPVDRAIEVPGLAELVRGLLELDGYRHDRPWLYKDPKLTLLWPTFRTAFPGARWIVVRRDVQAVIRSCLQVPFLRQHSGDLRFWEGFVAAYQERLQHLLDSGVECHELQSEAVAAGKLDELERVLGALGLGQHPNPERLREFILPEAWHHGGSAAG